jgi:hypothetical protein
MRLDDPASRTHGQIPSVRSACRRVSGDWGELLWKFENGELPGILSWASPLVRRSDGQTAV